MGLSLKDHHPSCYTVTQPPWSGPAPLSLYTATSRMFSKGQISQVPNTFTDRHMHPAVGGWRALSGLWLGQRRQLRTPSCVLRVRVHPHCLEREQGAGWAPSSALAYRLLECTWTRPYSPAPTKPRGCVLPAMPALGLSHPSHSALPAGANLFVYFHSF